MRNLELVDYLEVGAGEIVGFLERNRQHLAESMPLRVPEFYTDKYWIDALERYKNSKSERREVRFALVDKNTMVGSIVFDQIAYGAFQACFLGYAIDQEYQGKGLMRHALSESLEQVAKGYGLNRVMANYEPTNQRSGRLLESLGFEREGYARKYLKLNGVWKDHILTSLILNS